MSKVSYDVEVELKGTATIKVEADAEEPLDAEAVVHEEWSIEDVLEGAISDNCFEVEIVGVVPSD